MGTWRYGSVEQELFHFTGRHAAHDAAAACDGNRVALRQLALCLDAAALAGQVRIPLGRRQVVIGARRRRLRRPEARPFETRRAILLGLLLILASLLDWLGTGPPGLQVKDLLENSVKARDTNCCLYPPAALGLQQIFSLVSISSTGFQIFVAELFRSGHAC